MGQPVIHFEVMGKDGAALHSFYSRLFGWEIDANNPMNYGTVQRDGNTAADGTGIGGGIEVTPEGYSGHVTFYVEVPDVEAALVARYDVTALVSLLHDEAVMSMPPYDFWLRGPIEMGRWFLGQGSGCRGSRLVATAANGCSAFGSYRPDGQGGHQPWAIQVIEV